MEYWAEQVAEYQGKDADELLDDPQFLADYESAFGPHVDDEEFNDRVDTGDFQEASDFYFEDGQALGAFLADYLDWEPDEIDEFFGYQTDD